jgi:hypothetical protein
MRRLALLSMVMLGGRLAAAQEPAPLNPYGPYDEQSEEGTVGTTIEDDMAPADDDADAAQPFEAELAPYGDWVNDDTYGEVWMPSEQVVGPDFTPYATGGYWNNTEYGWTWISDWDWGWAPFHYGRWTRLPSHHWCWVPGRTWGPGWVTWRHGGGYTGWAALPPRRWVRDHRGSGNHNVPGWRFTASTSLGGRMNYVNGRAVVGYTAPVRNIRTMALGHATVRYIAGPTSTWAPVHLAQAAPRMMPRFTATAYRGPASVYGRQPRVYHTMTTQGYAAPARTYSAPARTYAGPARGYAPARTYNAPARTYVAPRPVYRAPMMHAAPAMRPMSSPSFHPAPAPVRSGGGHATVRHGR